VKIDKRKTPAPIRKTGRALGLWVMVYGACRRRLPLDQ